MITSQMAANVIASIISIGGIWVLLYWFYQRYRIDRFRYELFTLRAELFDVARTGDVAFDHPAYTQLRTMINGFIRFADRIGFIATIFAVAAFRRLPRDAKPVGTEESWHDVTANLSPAARAQLNDLRARMHLEVLKQVLFSSPALSLTLVPAFLAFVAKRSAELFLWRLVGRAYQGAARFFRRLVFRPLDTMAYEVGGAAAG